jgi:hypothetical protein
MAFTSLAIANNGINGQWIAEDEKGNEILIEFTQEGNYYLSVNGQSLTSDVADYGQIKYSVVARGPQMTINLFDENKSKAFANLKAILKNGELRLSVLNGPNLVQKNGEIILRRTTTN